MARTDSQLNFRIPAELREQLEAAALANNRSLTGELVARLGQSFEGVSPAEVAKVLATVNQRLVALESYSQGGAGMVRDHLPPLPSPAPKGKMTSTPR